MGYIALSASLSVYVKNGYMKSCRSVCLTEGGAELNTHTDRAEGKPTDRISVRFGRVEAWVCLFALQSVNALKQPITLYFSDSLLCSR